jgi:hypothetical protein
MEQGAIASNDDNLFVGKDWLSAVARNDIEMCETILKEMGQNWCNEQQDKVNQHKYENMN